MPIAAAPQHVCLLQSRALRTTPFALPCCLFLLRLSFAPTLYVCAGLLCQRSLNEPCKASQMWNGNLPFHVHRSNKVKPGTQKRRPHVVFCAARQSSCLGPAPPLNPAPDSLDRPQPPILARSRRRAQLPTPDEFLEKQIMCTTCCLRWEESTKR